MPETADKILSQFALTGIPSLPELLLHELDNLQKQSDAQPQSAGGNSQAENLLENDLFLFARVLAGSFTSGTGNHVSPSDLPGFTDREALLAMVRQSAAKTCFVPMSSQRIRFLKQLYLQSILAREISEQLAQCVPANSDNKEEMVQQAGFCGQFLNIGALVLEQVHKAGYLGILQQTASTEQLLEAETAEFCIDHAALGAALLQRYGLDGFCCDAVRYHHHPVAEILDATPLVKIAWLANQLADEKENPEAPVWADTLFELHAGELSEIRENALARLDNISKSCRIQYSTTRYLPLPETEEEEVLKQEKRAFRLLRERVEAESLFAPVRETLLRLPVPSGLGSALDAAVRLLFGPFQSLVFTHEAASNTLRCIAGTVPENNMDQLIIRCESERSAIADSYLNGEAVFRLPQEDLTVIDRQLKSLMGSDNFCVEPLPGLKDGTPCGLLVTGIPLQNTESFKKNRYLRNALCNELGNVLARKQQNVATQSDLAAEYERRIRETIHEVNNPLGIIKNYLQLLSMKQEEVDQKVLSEISFMKSEIDRVGSILVKLKEMPGENKSAGTLDINAMISSLVSVFSGSLSADERISIETTLGPDLPEIVCDENAVRQIITNLVKNAAEAMEEGGKIWVKTAGNIYMNGNRYIQLSVKDNGPGIASNVLDTLFVPGISTKGGDHRGSGLSIVRELVEELNGRITCQTRPASQNNNQQSETCGTEFSVLLPLIQSVNSWR